MVSSTIVSDGDAGLSRALLVLGLAAVALSAVPVAEHAAAARAATRLHPCAESHAGLGAARAAADAAANHANSGNACVRGSMSTPAQCASAKVQHIRLQQTRRQGKSSQNSGSPAMSAGVSACELRILPTRASYSACLMLRRSHTLLIMGTKMA